MRIYKVDIEHKKHGLNWRSKKVVAKDFMRAVAKVKLNKDERVEAIQILADTED